jgi:hypothetical protein
MNDREHMAVGLEWVIFSLVMVLCVIGAFVLPLRIVFSKWIGCFALGGLFIGIPLLMRAADRSRIRDAVQKMGGQPIRLTPKHEWWDSYRARMLGKKFEVVYVDPTGSTHRALCRTGFVQGVRWIEDTVVGMEYLDR